MVTLLFVIFLALGVVFYIVYTKADNGGGGACFISVISACIAIFLLVVWFWSLWGAIEGITINREIEMYEAENKRIEQQLETTVSNYMKFESITFKELKDTDAINLISLYPELKSDKLVQSQIKVYISNNKEIKELKKKQIEVSKFKFYLYFGR